MYPTYSLQVYDYIREQWVETAYEASNRHHHYEYLRGIWERLVSNASEGSPNQKPIGYRIIRDWKQVIDSWDNGKVPS